MYDSVAKELIERRLIEAKSVARKYYHLGRLQAGQRAYCPSEIRNIALWFEADLLE